MAKHNFSGVEEPRDFSPLPTGLYPLRVVKVELGWANAGGRQWEITWAVTENKYRDPNGIERELNCAGRTMRDWLRFDSSNELGYGRIRHILGALQVDWTGVDDEYPEILLGRECWAPVSMKESKSKPGQFYPTPGVSGFSKRDGWIEKYQPVPPSNASGMHQHPGAPEDPIGRDFTETVPW